MTTTLLTPREVALLLKVHPDTLEQWRGRSTESHPVGPPWIKLGENKQSPIRYRSSEIEKYLRECECK